jgi:hypothetical protein
MAAFLFSLFRAGVFDGRCKGYRPSEYCPRKPARNAPNRGLDMRFCFSIGKPNWSPDVMT